MHRAPRHRDARAPLVHAKCEGVGLGTGCDDLDVDVRVLLPQREQVDGRRVVHSQHEVRVAGADLGIDLPEPVHDHDAHLDRRDVARQLDPARPGIGLEGDVEVGDAPRSGHRPCLTRLS